MHTPIHICFVVHEYLPDIDDPDEFLNAIFSLTDWCEGLASDAHYKISAIIRFPIAAKVHRNGVHYQFVNDHYGPALRFWQIPKKLHQKVTDLAPDIIHAHNLNKVLAHHHLLKLLQPKQSFVLQNHAERPRYWLQSLVQRLVYQKVDAFLFTAKGQESIWIKKKIIASHQVHFVLEASNHFERTTRALAQKITEIKGDPVFLWVGNLNQNKDPLTILAALSNLFQEYPEAQLYMIYRFAPLIQEVTAFIQSQPALKGRVHLLGPKDRADLPNYYNSAHYFMLGSHQEGSGYSALEAIACGCVPILTNIPSFQLMTNNGKIGQLWPCGDKAALEQATHAALQVPWKKASTQCTEHFEEHLSYPVLFKKVKAVYQAIL